MKHVQSSSAKVRVLSGGLHSLVVAYPGRIGYWRIGIPPSGPMDDYSLRIGNRIIGNRHANDSSHYNFENAAGVEITYKGPKLQFSDDTHIALTGARIQHANINGERDLSQDWYKPIPISKGDVLDLSDTNISAVDRGCRTYISIANGGFAVEPYLGSKTSFPMGKLGGPNNDGAVLSEGDILSYTPNTFKSPLADFSTLTNTNLSPDYVHAMVLQSSNNSSQNNGIIWDIGVLSGPQSSPDYLTESDVSLLYETTYEVSHNASRLGIRLNPLASEINDSNSKPAKFSWARVDGGEGGSHPSNLIDNPYPIGSVNFTGDYPVILTVDGPSLGGFVCPITIPSTELWKVGQLKPSDKVRFRLLPSLQNVISERASMCNAVESSPSVDSVVAEYSVYADGLRPVIHSIEANAQKNQPKVQYRMGGDRYLLIDYGDDEVDVNLRVRVHKLEEFLMGMKLNGVVDTIPGVKTLLIEYDPLMLSLKYLLSVLTDVEENFVCAAMDTEANEIKLPSRVFNLPFVFNCEWTKMAIERYMNEVRAKAAYLPSNTEFICNNNGLEGGMEELERMIYEISFLVLGLGDVYLGAPCAMPVDPRHRLNVPKYNPSRNFTPEGAVGIGGKFMCIYPMESPGGYQLIGRTLQIFEKLNPEQKPWLLNMFDQVRFHPVSPAELTSIRQDVARGSYAIDMTHSEFCLNDYNAFVNEAAMQEDVRKFKDKQKVHQKKQLSYDLMLMEQDELALQEVVYDNILRFQAQMIVNGAQFGTGLYLYVKRLLDGDETMDIQVDQVNYITPLNRVEGKQMKVTVHNKAYVIALKGVYVAEESGDAADLYDVQFDVNGKAYSVTGVQMAKESADYVRFDTVNGKGSKEKVEVEPVTSNVEIDLSLESIYSALPGKLVKMHINLGDQIEEGDVIATVSAMKMETAIHSHTRGTVVFINPDELLSPKDIIAQIQQF